MYLYYQGKLLKLFAKATCKFFSVGCLHSQTNLSPGLDSQKWSNMSDYFCIPSLSWLFTEQKTQMGHYPVPQFLPTFQKTPLFFSLLFTLYHTVRAVLVRPIGSRFVSPPSYVQS